MARQRYTQLQVADAIRSTRGLVALAARQLGCDRSTVENYLHRYPKVREALEDARTQQLDVAEAKLFQAIDRGELSAVTFYLRSVGRRRGYGDHVELDGHVEVLQHPAWLQTRAMLLEVLTRYPEARMAVVTRLRALQDRHDDEEDGG